MALKKAGLSAKAKANTSVVKRSSQEMETLKSGVYADSKQKIGGSPVPSGRTVGVAVGTTLNMDNYESLRVDVWISDEVQDGETIEAAYDRLRGVISNQLVETVAEFKGE